MTIEPFSADPDSGTFHQGRWKLSRPRDGWGVEFSGGGAHAPSPFPFRLAFALGRRKARDARRPGRLGQKLKEDSFQVFLLSKVQFAPLLERHFRGFPGHCLSCRICEGAHKHRTVMTAHADMASHQSKQEQGTEPIPRSGGAQNGQFFTLIGRIFSGCSPLSCVQSCSMRFRVSGAAEENTDPDGILGLPANP